ALGSGRAGDAAGRPPFGVRKKRARGWGVRGDRGAGRVGRDSGERRRDAKRKEPTVKIAVVGRGNVGGGLGDLWEKAGHDVARIGKEGGDVSDADAVLVAVPGGGIADALDRVQGLAGKTVIDATNLIGAEPPSGFASNAEFVKSRTNGPTAKSFNLNFANQYGKLGEAKSRPSNLWSGDEEARGVVEQLNRD